MFKYIGNFEELVKYGFKRSENAVMVRYTYNICDTVWLVIYCDKDYRGRSQNEYAYNHISRDIFNKKYYKVEKHKWLIPRIIYVTGWEITGNRYLEDKEIISNLINDNLIESVVE